MRGTRSVKNKETGVFNYGPLPYDKELIAPKSSSGSIPHIPNPNSLIPEDDFPDGSYEIVVAGGQIFPLTKRDGVCEWRV